MATRPLLPSRGLGVKLHRPNSMLIKSYLLDNGLLWVFIQLGSEDWVGVLPIEVGPVAGEEEREAYTGGTIACSGMCNAHVSK